MTDNISQKKRRLDEEAQDGQLVGPQLPLAGGMTHSQRVEILEQKLRHLRSWMQQLQKVMEGSNQMSAQNSRRLFVGGLPADITQEELIQFLEDAIARSGAGIMPGNAINFCRIQPEKNFAFIEVRSAEEATNMLALDGVCMRGEVALKIKRPSKFDAHTALMLGPSAPDPTIDLHALIVRKAPGTGDSFAQGRYERNWNTLYVGGLPMEWGEQQVLDLLQQYGSIKYLKLMMDKETNRPKGYAFAEYIDDAGTNEALTKLNGQNVGPRFITVNRLLEHKAAQQQMGMAQPAPPAGMARPMGGNMGGGGMGGGMGMGGNLGMGQGGGGAGAPMQPGLGAGMGQGGHDMMGGQMGGQMGQMGGMGMASGMGMGGGGMGMSQGNMGMGQGTMMPTPPQQQSGMIGMGMNAGGLGQQGMYNQQGGGYSSQMGGQSGGYGQQQMGGGYGQMGGQQALYNQQQDMYGQSGMGMSTMGSQQMGGGYGQQGNTMGMSGYAQDGTYGLDGTGGYTQQGQMTQMQPPQQPQPPPRPDYVTGATGPTSVDVSSAAALVGTSTSGPMGMPAQPQPPTHPPPMPVGSQGMGGMTVNPGAWNQAPAGPMGYGGVQQQLQQPQYASYPQQAKGQYASYPGQ